LKPRTGLKLKLSQNVHWVTLSFAKTKVFNFGFKSDLNLNGYR